MYLSDLRRSFRAKDLLGFVVILAGLAMSYSCRTTRPDADKGVVMSVASEGGFVLTAPEQEEIYRIMTAVEKSAGVEVSTATLHSAKGIVECNKDGSVESCGVRVRTSPQAGLSAEQKLGGDLTGRLWAFFRGARKELETQNRVVADLFCDFVGKATPPYGQEGLRCFMKHPRLTNEAFFADLEAEELSHALRGDEAYDATRTELLGSITCQKGDDAGRAKCFVRPVVNGVLLDKVVEISDRYSYSVERRLGIVMADHLATTVKDKPVELPGSLVGAMSCSVDSSKMKVLERRVFLCRITL
jgi:hypothetical protein